MSYQCEYCGKFCKPYNSGVYYGGVLDIEPPETVYICKTCVDRELKTPEKVIAGCWWCKPNHVRIAKSIIRHRRKHYGK